MKRTFALETLKKIGKKVTLFGWVNSRRDHGKLVFIDLRDRSGIIQLVAGKGAREIRDEFVVKVEGVVRRRPKEMINPELETGRIEIKAGKIEVLAASKTPPFDLHGDGREIDEALRLKSRYLDLRRSRLVKNLELRQKVVAGIREWLDKRGFIEIETPNLLSSTNSSSWWQDLKDTIRLRVVSAMRIPVLTVLMASSASLIWRCPLLIRVRFLS